MSNPPRGLLAANSLYLNLEYAFDNLYQYAYEMHESGNKLVSYYKSHEIFRDSYHLFFLDNANVKKGLNTIQIYYLSS